MDHWFSRASRTVYISRDSLFTFTRAKVRNVLRQKTGKNLSAAKDNDGLKNINVPARKVPRFKAGKGLREKVK